MRDRITHNLYHVLLSLKRGTVSARKITLLIDYCVNYYCGLLLIFNTNFELKFLCADMFPCEDSKTVSVRLYPEKRNNHSFVNISPTLEIDTSMERSSQVYNMETQKYEFSKIKLAKARKNSSVRGTFQGYILE